jgi:hypothetical protein
VPDSPDRPLLKQQRLDLFLLVGILIQAPSEYDHCICQAMDGSLHPQPAPCGHHTDAHETPVDAKHENQKNQQDRLAGLA